MAIILVVDDQPSITWLVSAVLVSEGHTVITATSGPEADELIDEHPFDLMISDVQMPIIDGFNLVRQVRAKHPHLKCVLMSGDADFEDPGTRAEVQRLQVAATIEKPFLMGQLLEMVDRVLATE